MTNQGRSAAAVATAAGVGLSVAALAIALSTGTRDLESLRAAARAGTPDVVAALAVDTSPLVAAAYCFDPLRPPSLEVMALIQEKMEAGTDYNLGGGSWSSGAGIPPSTLTWSLVPDGTQLPGLSSGYSPSTLFATMDAKFGNNRQLWISKVQAVFDRWGAVTGVNYQRVTNNGQEWDDGASFPNSNGSTVSGSTRGQVRIGMRPLDGGGGVLAFNMYPQGGDMVMDSAENWQSSGGDYRFFRNTVSHEHGHGLGIAHVCPINNTKLMEPYLSTSFDGPQHDDVRAGHARYGDQFEPNNSAGVAKDLGTIPLATTATPSVVPGMPIGNTTTMSIDRLQDQDWYKFTITGAANLNVTLTPKGISYLSGPQNTNGSCSAGSATSSLLAADLNLTVYGTNGATVLGTAAAAPAGGTEAIVALPLPAAGTYYLKVAASSVSSVQMYDLSINPSSGVICPQFADQPLDADLCVGGFLTLYANASGTPAPTFQWRKNGSNIPGATSTTFTISGVSLTDQGTYTCVATNSCGSATSEPAVVTVSGITGFTLQPSTQTVQPGEPVTLAVGVSHQGPVTYQWRKDNSNVQGATGAIYHIPSVGMEHQGTYVCEILGACDLVYSDPATLTVGGPVACYANCDGSTSAPVLNVADFTCFLQDFAAGCP